jgi:hypothetical protein
MRYLIITKNTACRLENKIKEIKECTSREEQILKKLEKGRAIENQPTSLANALPYRGSDGSNENKKQLCGKIETIQRAIKSGELSEKDRIECRALKMKMRKREPDNSDVLTKSLIAKKRRGIVGAIEHNQRSQQGSLEKPIVLTESDLE